MTIFISGGAKNGKSTLAQNTAVKLSEGGKRYYIATMIPVDEEDRERIRRHIADRDGLGFETIECPRNILNCLKLGDPQGTFLLDSATALFMNELFRQERNYEMDPEAPYRCARELCEFVRSVKNAVIVSDGIYSDAQKFDESTEVYRRGLARIDRALAGACDTVVEVSAGVPIVQKGALPL